jgi:hypothetical protein
MMAKSRRYKQWFEARQRMETSCTAAMALAKAGA